MKQWYQLKRFFFYRSAKANAPLNVSRELMNLAKAKTIGIAFDGSLAESTSAVGKFVSELEGKNVDVKTLAFLPNEKNETPAAHTFTLKQTAWNFVPHSEAVEGFCNQRFDILLALFQHEILPLEYIAITSKAKCRVGLFHPEKTAIFELMIKPQKNIMTDFLTQAATLLNQIKA